MQPINCIAFTSGVVQFCKTRHFDLIERNYCVLEHTVAIFIFGKNKIKIIIHKQNFCGHT